MNKRENITIPWESRNGIVLDKSIINDTQEDTKNILNIILNALSAISGTKGTIISNDNLHANHLYKFFHKEGFGYNTGDGEMLNDEKLKEVSDNIKKQAKEDIIGSIEMAGGIQEYEKYAFKYLFQNRIINELNIKKAINVFFKKTIKEIAETLPNQKKNEFQRPSEDDKKTAEERFSPEENKILAYMLKENKIPKNKKYSILEGLALHTNYNTWQTYNNIIEKFIQKQDLIQTYFENITQTK